MTPLERPRAFIPAILIAAVVMILTGLAAFLLLESAVERSTPALEAATRAGAAAVGNAVAGQIAHALEIGIPLDRLEDVEPYLQGIVSGSPQVKALALVDREGRTLHATADHVEGLRVPIAAGDTKATLVVATESSLVDSAVKQLEIALAVAAALTGLAASGLVVGFITFNQTPARRRFEHALSRIAAGNFSTTPFGEGRGRLSAASHALALAVEKIEAARIGLVESIATIRAIDFDGSLGRRVDAILNAIDSRYVLAASTEESDRQPDQPASESGVIWQLAVILGLYAAAFPLVANFAIDREPLEIARAWWPVLPLLAELAAVVLGAMLGSRRGGGSRAGRAVATIVLGVCLAATYWCRSYEGFILLRVGAGFAGGAVTAALLGGRLTFEYRNLFSMLVFSMLIVGPLSSALLTEAVGRRAAFLVLGAVALITALFVAAGAGASGKIETSARRTPLPYSSDLILALAVIPAGALVLVEIPAGFGYDNYLAGAGIIALLGVGALAAPVVLPLVPAAGLLAAAFVFYVAPEAAAALLLAAASAGFSMGAVLKANNVIARREWLAIGWGVGIALIAAGVGGYSRLPIAILFAAAALLIIVVDLIGRRQTAGQPA